MVLESKIGEIEAYQAFEILITLGLGRETVTFDDEPKTIFELKKMMVDLRSMSAPAHKLKLAFWGGPPENEDWFKGDLRMFLIDNIFRQEIEEQEWDLLNDFYMESISK